MPETEITSNNAAGQTYTMDLTTNPILATLPGTGLSSKVSCPTAVAVPSSLPMVNNASAAAGGYL